MSEFIAIVFDNEEDADQALASVRGLEADGRLRLTDTAVVRKDPDGQVHRKDQVSSGTKTGAVFGGVIGLLLFIVFPIAGIVGGAIVGGLVGSRLMPGLDGEFTKEVADDLRPGGSALFLLMAEHPAEGLIVAAMRPYSGRVHQTTLSEETESQLDEALRQMKD